MTDDQVQETGQGKRRSRATELPPDVFAVLHKPNRGINPIAIVATVDQDGMPRTAPFGSLRAVTPKLLRFASNDYHDTYTNLCRDGRVMVALLSPPNIAVSIRGKARVVKERMDTDKHLVVIEIDVEEVKNDMLRRGVIESAIGFTPPDDLMDYYVGAIAEIEDM